MNHTSLEGDIFAPSLLGWDFFFFPFFMSTSCMNGNNLNEKFRQLPL